jgi:hypothetical protein
MEKLRDLFVDFMLSLIGIFGVISVLFGLTSENSVLYVIFGAATLFTMAWLFIYLCLFGLLGKLVRLFWSIIKW